MVAEDNIEQNSACCKFLTKDKDIKIVSRTLDGKSTIKEYLLKKPDVLLLDLNLPVLNGLDVIENLSLDINERKKCNIIIITGNASLRLNISNTSKVYKIITKPYNYNELLSTIKEIGSTLEELTRKEIKDLLYELKFNMYSKGSRYIADAIELAYKDIDLLSNVTELYKRVAAINNEKMNKIQRSIRSSIDVMNNHISKEQLRSFFHIYDNDIITPKYFFTRVVDYFIELKEK
jgi:DNA-binding response OmpR family regulator